MLRLRAGLFPTTCFLRPEVRAPAALRYPICQRIHHTMSFSRRLFFSTSFTSIIIRVSRCEAPGHFIGVAVIPAMGRKRLKTEDGLCCICLLPWCLVFGDRVPGVSTRLCRLNCPAVSRTDEISFPVFHGLTPCTNFTQWQLIRPGKPSPVCTHSSFPILDTGSRRGC